MKKAASESVSMLKDCVLDRSVDEWLACFKPGTVIGDLLARPAAEQARLGYRHTLREIAQQPVVWTETAAGMTAAHDVVQRALGKGGVSGREGTLLLTGSGSSLYVGECVALPLQQTLSVPVQAVPAGLLLTHGGACLPPRGPYLVVSFARSGNSPESTAVLTRLLEDDTRGHHLILTCNREGALATAAARHPRVDAIVLDEKTLDRSLVMTSSFTSLVLAAGLLGATSDSASYRARADALARAAAALLVGEGDRLAAAARGGFRSAVYLGSGCRVGAAREAGLKMLEMTAGRVNTLAESFLGVRHGPLSAVHPDTLVVAFLSSDETIRAYELDLLAELERKQLGARKVVVGCRVPPDLATRAGDLILSCGLEEPLSDADLVLFDVLVGQLLAFFRCREEGLEPDAPSAGGVINRVVEAFTIHRRPPAP
jgi:tagatose-6-phosphate ketose/aldose isomerase